jgi:hypothetical protein
LVNENENENENEKEKEKGVNNFEIPSQENALLMLVSSFVFFSPFVPFYGYRMLNRGLDVLGDFVNVDA